MTTTLTATMRLMNATAPGETIDVSEVSLAGSPLQAWFFCRYLVGFRGNQANKA